MNCDTVQRVGVLLVVVYLAVMAPVAHLRTVGDYFKETD
jgi:hypothetical protein